MARPLRLEFAGACYHLTARGDRQESIFEDDEGRLVFLDLLAKEVLRQGWLLYAFCLMGNTQIQSEIEARPTEDTLEQVVAKL